jgi:hypothetical protein
VPDERHWFRFFVFLFCLFRAGHIFRPLNIFSSSSVLSVILSAAEPLFNRYQLFGGRLNQTDGYKALQAKQAGLDHAGEQG